MIRKGIIESIDSRYSISIRIPELNSISASASGATNSNLFSATICTLPGIYPAYKVGDIVFVGFESDEVENPIVLGLLYRKEGTNSTSDVRADSIYIETNLVLPEG